MRRIKVTEEINKTDVLNCFYVTKKKTCKVCGKLKPIEDYFSYRSRNCLTCAQIHTSQKPLIYRDCAVCGKKLPIPAWKVCNGCKRPYENNRI